MIQYAAYAGANFKYFNYILYILFEQRKRNIFSEYVDSVLRNKNRNIAVLSFLFQT